MPALALAGCASFNGQPEPVVSVSTADSLLGKYPIDQVWTQYEAAQGDKQRIYRNAVIYAYLQAIDARYAAFRQKLSSEHKGTDLAFDGLLLGAGAIGSLVASAANEAAVGTTALVGARASVDKNLYFEKTLPALLSTMDAERFRVAAAIQGKLSHDTGQYPLGAALADLQAYQLAGSVDFAVNQMNSTAATDRAEAKLEFDRSFRFACDPKADLTLETAKLRNAVMPIARAALVEQSAGTATARQDVLKQVAPYFETPPTGNVEDITLGITDTLNRDYCSLDKLKNLESRLKVAFPNEPTMKGL